MQVKKEEGETPEDGLGKRASCRRVSQRFSRRKEKPCRNAKRWGTREDGKSKINVGRNRAPSVDAEVEKVRK